MELMMIRQNNEIYSRRENVDYVLLLLLLLLLAMQ
jgi:hypothetical protein